MKITDISRTKEQKPYRFGAYCRVSTDKDDQIHSFLAQLKYFREYANTHEGYTLVDIYADEGITGTSIDKRDEFLRMIRDCKDGKINRIVTKSVSRFARNDEELLATIRELKAIGISILFEKEGIDTRDMSSEFMVSIFGMQAQQESKSISDNVRWSYKARMQNGEFNTCTAPLGYRLENGKLVIYEEEAKIVRRIFKMYLSGLGTQQIARILNEEEVLKQSRNKKWYPASIMYILTNERYMGDVCLQKSYTTDTLPYRVKLNYGEKAKYYVKNSNPGIVSKQEFDDVKAMVEEKRPKPRIETASVFKGFLKCGDCGRVMRRMKNNSGYYWCCKNAANKQGKCTLHIIYEKELSRACERMVMKLVNNSDELIGKTINYIEQVITTQGSRRAAIHKIDLEIKAATERNHHLASLRVKNIITDEELAKNKFEIISTIARLRSERKKMLHLDQNDESLDTLILLKDTIDKIDNYDDEIIKELVDEIHVEEDGKLAFYLIGGLIVKEKWNI